MAELTPYQIAKSKLFEYLSFDGDYIRLFSDQEIKSLIVYVKEAALIQTDPELQNLLTGFQDVLTYRLETRIKHRSLWANIHEDYVNKGRPIKKDFQRQTVCEKKKDQVTKPSIFSTLFKLGGLIWRSKPALTSVEMIHTEDEPNGSLPKQYILQSSHASSTCLYGSSLPQKRQTQN